MYSILEIIHHKVRAEKGAIYNTIVAPKYSDVPDDSIYIFITRYQNYLMYEELSPEIRSYRKIEKYIFFSKHISATNDF